MNNIKNNKKVTNKNVNNKKINSKKMKSELVQHFLSMLMIIKVYHWKTYSYAEHKATDELYEILNKNIDKFVEIMLGKNECRLDMKGKKIEFSDPSTKKSLKVLVNNYKDLLENKMNNYINIHKDTDLTNIRDEILGNLNQFLYLITFK
jgi:DNA-binding ferritin-like protein